MHGDIKRVAACRVKPFELIDRSTIGNRSTDTDTLEDNVRVHEVFICELSRQRNAQCSTHLLPRQQTKLVGTHFESVAEISFWRIES